MNKQNCGTSTKLIPTLGDMDKKLSLRKALPKDAETLSALALRSKAHWGYSQAFMDQCKEELRVSALDIEKSSVDYTIGEIEGAIVGYMGVAQLAKNAYELDALFVDPAFFGKGIGRELLEHALESVCTHKDWSLIVQSDPNAANFYRACGGLKIGESESSSVAGRLLPLFRFKKCETERIAQQGVED